MTRRVTRPGPRVRATDRRARLVALRRAILRCRRCADLARCRSRVVPGAGAAAAKVAFVGIAPGRFGGDVTGVPFTRDRSGRLLRRMIAEVGLKRVFITNLVRCNPRDMRGRNRDPRAAEIANCRPHLEAELALVRPRIVVCLGRIAWRHLAPHNVRFAPRHARLVVVGRRVLYPMYHPAFVNRGAYTVRSYARDFARLAEIVRGAD